MRTKDSLYLVATKAYPVFPGIMAGRTGSLGIHSSRRNRFNVRFHMLAPHFGIYWMGNYDLNESDSAKSQASLEPSWLIENEGSPARLRRTQLSCRYCQHHHPLSRRVDNVFSRRNDAAISFEKYCSFRESFNFKRSLRTQLCRRTPAKRHSSWFA